MKTFCFLLFLLAGNTFIGVGGQSVNYKHSDICAVRGSTVTLPCTFTPPYEISRGVVNIKTTRMEVVRVVWCKNHEICQGATPSVYDSESTENHPRYRYLGDKKGNCTLQISDLQANDDATFRFRMETKDPRGNFSGRKGVNVIVVDEPRMEVVGSSHDFNEGETVTLRCSSLCTFHQLEVNWSKDGYALPESGPTIQVGPLTAKHSGNYSCALRTNSLSAPFSLQLEPEGEHGGTVPVDRVVLFTLHTVLIITVVLVVIKRKLQQKAEGSDREGGFICMSRIDPRCESGDEYKANMERELQQMEEEDLLKLVDTREMNNYIRDPFGSYSAEEQDERFLHGTVYLYRKVQ